MTEWILRPKDDREEVDDLPDPWSPWYDKCFGMVVRAETEQEAREVAQDHAKQEVRVSKHLEGIGDRIVDREVWTDERLATCIPISEYEPDNGQLLIQDVHMA